MKNKFVLPASIIIAGLLIAGAFFYVNKNNIKILSAQQAADRAINFVNKTIAAEGATTTATLDSVTKENGVYKLSFKIGTNQITGLVTQDGRYLLIGPNPYSAYDISVSPEVPTTSASSQNTTQPKATCDTLTKNADPTLEVFVVSNCPYGLQMQRILGEIVKNIPTLSANIRVEYIGAIQNNKITSMHGDAEAQENLRQICIREEQAAKFWNYLDCYMQAGKSDSCLTSANINKTQLTSCETDSSRGLTYAQNDFVKAQQYGVSGSPTLILNGVQVSEFDFGGRTADAVKTVICCGSQQKPGVCSQALSTTSAATSFSTTYGGTGTTNNSANCAPAN
jgi:hypothetical protein